MFQTRQEVDKHVNNSLKKVNNETEKNLRCFSFAKLYFNVGDYEQTVRYVTSYLSVKPKSPEGHNLLGKALEKLGKKDAALEAYRTSLQQDPKQNHLVLKVCELMAQDDVDIDNSGARYFCDLAQNLDPQNPVVSTLKEKLITSDRKDPNEISQFLLKELENRPTDVTLRVRLLKHLLQNNMIKEAYKHAADIEQKKLEMFNNYLPWYETFAEVLVRYQKDTLSTQLTWEFWFLSVSVLEKLVALSLDDHLDNVKSPTDYIATVFNFDQSFLKASQSISSCPDKNLQKEFLTHYEGQLCFQLSVLAFKQAKKGFTTFKEVQNIVLPLLFTSYNITPPDIQGVWFNSVSENWRKIILGWHKEGCFRCSQVGHILLSLSKDRKNILLEKANQYSTGMWRDQFFKKMFVKRDQQLKSNTSFFMSSSLDPVIKLPDVLDLIKYDEVAQTLYPDSLHHYIWIALNCQNLSDFSLKTFDGLQYTVKNLNNCAAESLNILDLQSFIYSAALCARASISNADASLNYFSQDRPSVLPASITGNLGVLNQAKFISAAYRMYKNENVSNMGEIRMLLLRGIEVIRCVGNHGLDVKLLICLASTFAARANILTKQSEIDANNSRAELYWKTALPLLEKFKNNYAVVYPKNRLFEYKTNKDLSQEELSNYIERAKLFIGLQLMKKKEYEKAMNIFEGLKDPYASFYQSQIFKQMADSKTNQNKENVTSEMRSQNIILLSRARDCLYLTLDRLREPSQDKDHPLNVQLGTEIEKIERLLSRIDPDCANRNECDGMSDENVSDSSVGEHYLSTYTHHTSFQNGRDYTSKNDTHLQSTPLRLGVQRQEARPSPERLDAQLRQLLSSKDLAMNTLIDQNKMLSDLQRSLMDEIRGFKDAVKNLTSTVDDQAKHFTGCFEDIKHVKKTVDELSQSVDDRLQSVTDMVQEMKKEINDIKKDQNKNTQLSDEDLYVLDPEYNSALDYNLGNTLGNTPTNLNSVVGNIYPHYQPPRLPQGQALLPGFGAHGPWSGGYLGLPYPYGAIGLQPPFLPQADQQQLGQLGQIGNIPSLVQPGYQHPVNLSLGSLMAAQTQISQASVQAKDSPKVPLNITGSSHAGLPHTAASVGSTILGIQTTSGLTQISTKDNTKTTFSNSVSTNFGQAANIPTSVTANVNSLLNKTPPVNVVITSSDPLPSIKTSTTQPVLSVTIPPQHIKGNLQKSTVPQNITSSTQAHNYQIPLPTTNTLTTTPSILSKPSPIISTQSLLSGVPSPVISAVVLGQNASPNVSLGLQIEKTLDDTFSPEKKNSSLSKTTISLNKTNVSTTSVEEYDPRPDFKPIVPLPDEVPVTTGEEKEAELFCQRAKLFRHVNINGVKEWKERGVGNIKLLFNPETGKVRILMRRDQVHKICANHFLNKDMILTPMSKNDRAYIWAAHDFADGELVLEKFCVRFKTAEEAKKFADSFELAKTKINEKPVKEKSEHTQIMPQKKTELPKVETALGTLSSSSDLGGFKFTSTPTFKPKAQPKVEEQQKDSTQPSPFAGFSFGKTNEVGIKSSTWGNLWKPPAEGSWICKICEVVNKADQNKCVACETLKGGITNEVSGSLKGISLDTGGQKFTFGIPSTTVKPVPPTVENPTSITAVQKPEQPVQKFSFSIPATTKDNSDAVLSGFGDSFKPKIGTWECKKCYVRNEPSSQFCLSCEAPKDDGGPKKEPVLKGVNLDTPGQKFVFGIPTATTVSNQNTPDTTFAFGDAAKVISPWKPPVNPTITENVELQAKSVEKQDQSFIFGSPQKHDFEFKPRSPRRISSGQGDESDGSYIEEEEANIYFKPVIPLPDKVEVKTGEENEEVLYCHRAKLFRFANGEWKERGLGDVKILKDSASGKLRVIMRREQVLKICLNHRLTEDIEYLTKDERTWLFHAPDFSEGELSREQFCLRFKNGDIANEFRQAVKDSLKGMKTLKSDTDEKSIDPKSSDSSDSDVELVSETKVTPEEEKEAVKLGLPPKFFAYRQRPDCKCEQCKKEDEYLKELFSKEPTQKSVQKISSDNSVLFSSPLTSIGTSSASSVFGTPTSFTFGTSSGQSPIVTQPLQKSETLKDLLQKTPISSESTSKNSNWFNFKLNQSGNDDTTPVSTSDMEKNTKPLFKNPVSHIFGQPSQNIFQAENTSFFSSSSKTGNLFAGSTPKEGSTNIFGGTTPKESSGIFGNKGEAKDSNSAVNIFSTVKPIIFGNNTPTNIFNTKATPSNIFGEITVTKSSSPASNIFSNNSASSFNSNSLFTSPLGTTNSKTSLEPSNLFIATTVTTSVTNPFQNTSITNLTTNNSSSGTGISANSSIFGNVGASTNASGNIFGASAQIPGSFNIFNSKQNTFEIKPVIGQTIFGSKSEPKVTDANLTFGSSAVANIKESDELMLKCDSDVSFASLAAQAESKTPPAFSNAKDNENPFAYLGAGTPVFGSQMAGKSQKTKNKDVSGKDGSDKEDDATDDKEHDPQFEPIVPLPDQIVVSTGEENETALFNERAKLFRYDSKTKEWKERGVGQIKILYHPENKTYRLLLRREQVHKVVLNERITPKLELKQMSTSDKAWMWLGHNYVDDEFNLEKLAIRFKNVEQAQAFKKVAEESVAKVVALMQSNKEQPSSNVPTTVQNFEDISNEELRNYEDHEDNPEYEEGDEDDEDDEDDDDDDRTIMFFKRCTLSEQNAEGTWHQIGMGDLQVYYDPELYATRICVTDDNGQVVSNTLIGTNTTMDVQDKDCSWKSIEWANADDIRWRNLKATFSSSIAAQEFYSNYLEGVNYAQEVGIVNEMPNEEDHESED